MLCPNCRQEAEEVTRDGVTYTVCETCGAFKYNQAGEPVPCELIDNSARSLEGGQEIVCVPSGQEAGPDSKPLEREAEEPAPDIKPKPKPKPQSPNDSGPCLGIHFDDE